MRVALLLSTVMAGCTIEASPRVGVADCQDKANNLGYEQAFVRCEPIQQLEVRKVGGLVVGICWCPGHVADGGVPDAP